MSIPSTLPETDLYRRLKELLDEPYQLEAGQRNRRAALALVDAVAAEAAALMGRAPVRFPEYTLHDEVHLRRVAHLMGVILKESDTLHRLSYLEITILILAAYLHDVGMVPAEEEIAAILESDDYELFRAGKRDERAGLRELELLLISAQPGSSEHVRYRRKADEIELGILTEYLRVRHGEAGWNWILKHYGSDPRWVLEGQNMAELVAWVCRGHVFHSHQLIAEYRAYFPVEKLVGQTPVNVLYCALLLRLADILDFDRERTPPVLYENISPRNEVSLQEWNKHLSITGWKISRERIVFEAECTHPAYEKALREFLDAIDSELQATLNIVRIFPGEDSIAERYRLTLPPVVDRSRVGAKNSMYTYVDLTFTLSHQDIMRLLMGQDFWGNPSLAVRELIQNAYDAIRHRRALELAAGNEWNGGKIVLRHRLNEEGQLELSCEDNGIGMTRHHLEKYFFRVGKSYYRSPEFEHERAGLKGKGADFDPVSQFGLGVVSTFMIGDRLSVRTQRYLGPNLGCGEAIEVSAEGPSRMVIMRSVNPPAPSPGTRVTVVGSLKRDEIDFETPSVELYTTVRYLALALEVPIEIHVEEPLGLVHETVYPRQRPLRLPTSIELTFPSSSFITVEKNIAEIFSDSEGTIRMFFLIDENGQVTIENGVARWALDADESRDFEDRFGLDCKAGRVERDEIEEINVLAQDGITVAGGRAFSKFGCSSPPPQVFHGGTFFINLRGRDKLPLQPNRRPYSEIVVRRPEDLQWHDFRVRVGAMASAAFEQILVDDRTRPLAEHIWSLVNIHGIRLGAISTRAAYQHMPLPVSLGNEQRWLSLDNLYSLGIRYVSIPDADDIAVTVKSDTAHLITKQYSIPFILDQDLLAHVESILRACTTIAVVDQQIVYSIAPHDIAFDRIGETARLDDWDLRPPYFQSYHPELRDFLAVQHILRGINITHPVGQYIFSRLRGFWVRRTLFDYSLEMLALLVSSPKFYTNAPTEWSSSICYFAIDIATLWENVDWSAIPPELRPPYRVMHPRSHTKVEITVELIRSQAQSAKERLQQLRGEIVNRARPDSM